MFFSLKFYDFVDELTWQSKNTGLAAFSSHVESRQAGAEAKRRYFTTIIAEIGNFSYFGYQITISARLFT